MVAISLALASCEKEPVKPTYSFTGKWKWETSCGGVVGCVNATPEDQRIRHISHREIKMNQNGRLKFATTYRLTNQYEQEGYTVYELDLNSGMEWVVKVKPSELSVEVSYAFQSIYRKM